MLPNPTSKLQLNKDHGSLEAEAVGRGWSLVHDDSDENDEEQIKQKVWSRRSFALLPVNSLKRRHVRIDNDVFLNIVYRKVYGEKPPKEFEEEAFLALFKVGGKRRADVRELRSRAKGWQIGKSFSTDGTSISILFNNASRGETTEVKKLREKGVARPEDMVRVYDIKDRKVGVDPGRENLMTTYELLPDGTHDVNKLTRKDFYEVGGLDAVKLQRERRHNMYKVAMAAVSSTRRRTADAVEFAQYVKAVWTNIADLRLAYGGRSACSESFRTYRGKAKVLDGFLAGLGEHTEGGRLHIGYGNAKFDSSGKGERSVPVQAIPRRILSAYKDRMDLTMVDEYMTTQLSAVGPEHARLGVPYRTVGDRTYPDRDVRFCSSESLLGSHHPCPPPASLCAGLVKPAGSEWVCRDGNSACCMALLMGLSHDARPPAFQRKRETTNM
jgi:hypothetical protein